MTDLLVPDKELINDDDSISRTDISKRLIGFGQSSNLESISHSEEAIKAPWYE